MYEVPVAVKDALRDGTQLKNYRFLVLNDDGTTDFTIDNNYLVSESVIIDERMCSGDTIKYGLCEGSSIEFQYFDKPNITGRRIRAYIDVNYGSSTSSIPMGYFTIDKCSRQASTGILKATGYNQLMSEYLNAKANDLLIDAYNNQGSYSPSTIEKILDIALDDYKIDAYSVVSKTTSITIQYAEASAVYGDQAAYQGDPPPPGGGVTVDGYLHWFAPLIRVTFSNTGHNYRYRVNAGTINHHAVELLRGYSDWRSASNDKLLTDWVCDPGTSLSDIRGGAIILNYTGTGSATNETNYIGDYDGEGASNVSPYYYTINSKTDYFGNSYQIGFYAPVVMFIDQNPTMSQQDWTNYLGGSMAQLGPEIRDLIKNNVQIQMQNASVASDMTVGAEIETWPDVTLRELQSAIFELQCQFGQLSRETDLFSGVELNRSRLYPADSLYPANNLYPDGAAASANKSTYSQLWADEGNVRKWRYLIITYKGTENGQEVEKTLQKTVNADGTDDYEMTDNWLFKNLVWTDSDVGDYADAMKAKMQDITWFPFEMWCAGLPYLETGDEIEIPLGNYTYTSYVLQRQLKGIQNLQDTYINGTLDIF